MPEKKICGYFNGKIFYTSGNWAKCMISKAIFSQRLISRSNHRCLNIPASKKITKSLTFWCLGSFCSKNLLRETKKDLILGKVKIKND